MFLFVLLYLPFLVSSEVCLINSTIGIWLTNNTNRRCETVKGHFILDRAADSLTGDLYRTFDGLKRIEGCIHVKNYTGSRNLSFFSRLEEVICDESEAKRANLTNVIHVHEPYLHTMGFDSLRNVTGPGEIYLSFEDYQLTYGRLYFEESYTIEGQACFSKKEMVFLARHPQFIGKMYRACETDDPCFRPELFKDFYTFEDIPENCTNFAGMVCIVGPYPEDLSAYQKFKNLTLLIGQLQIGPNLFTSLEMFSNLEIVYPYMAGHNWHPCYDSFFSLEESRGLQSISIGLSRFMRNISLPSLKPNRPLEINQPTANRQLSEFAFDYLLYFPEPVPNPCVQFPQFGENCHLGYKWNVGENAPRNIPYIEEAWLAGTIFVLIGLWFGKRCIAAIFSRQLKYSLPYSQYFMVTVILIMILSAVESVIINQIAYDTLFTRNQEHYVFAQFTSPRLLHPFPQAIIRFLAACRQTSLIILILCYPDIILSYCWKRWNLRFSLFYIISASIVSFIAYVYFSSQLTIEFRTMRPHYMDKKVSFVVFVMNTAGQQNLTKWSPGRGVVPTLQGAIKFLRWIDQPYDYMGRVEFNYIGPNDMQLEILGGAFPEISSYCDVIFTTLVVCFFALKAAKRIGSRDNFYILILLYLQMSMNRICSFISYDILAMEYIDYSTDERRGQDRLFDPEKQNAEYKKAIWIIIRILEKLPYFSFMVVSFCCWNYIQYYRRLGLALIYREQKQLNKKNHNTKISISDSRLVSIVNLETNR